MSIYIAIIFSACKFKESCLTATMNHRHFCYVVHCSLDHHGNNEADNEMHEDVDLSRGMPESPEDSTRMESNAISGTLAKLIERGQNLRNRMLLSTIETPQTPTRR